MEATQKTVRVAIYSRISDDTEGTELGVQRQEEDCLKQIRDEGWTLWKTYRENDVSASTRSKSPRPVYARMLDDARAGKFDLILSYSNSRLTRRPLELEDLITLHETHGMELRTVVSGRDDLGTADGRMVARIKASVDAAEAERTGERVLRKQAQKRSAGFIGTKRAFGWSMTYNGAERLPDALHETEGPALAAGLQMILEGGSVGSVARFWNSQGLTTTTGNPWTVSRTKDALTRWRNAGVLDHKGDLTEGIFQRACTREELEKVRAALSRPDAKRGKGRPAVNLLSGIAVCGKCGRPLLHGQQVSRRVSRDDWWFDVYRCSGSQDQTGNKCFLSIKKDSIEPLVTRAIYQKLFFGDPESLGPGAEHQKTVADLSVERAAIEEDERQIGELLGARTMSVTVAQTASKGLRERRETIDQEIAHITSRYALKSLFASAETDLGERAQSIAREFSTMHGDQRREIVGALVTVTVNPGRDAFTRVVIVDRATGEVLSDEFDPVL